MAYRSEQRSGPSHVAQDQSLHASPRRKDHHRVGRHLRIPCGLCWVPINLASNYVELRDGRAHLRCPYCGGVSLVRWNASISTQ